MQLPKLLKHYGISVQQLESLLSENGIKANLRFIKQVPEEWFNMLSATTAIEPPIYIGELNKPLVNELVEEEKYEKIDLSNINTLVHHYQASKVAFNNRGNVIYHKGKEKSKKEYFWAFVKFADSNKSFGFVKRIKDLNNLDFDQLSIKDEQNDYYIAVQNDDLKGGELVICSSETYNSNRKRAEIEVLQHLGINGINKITALSEFLSETEFIDIETQVDLNTEGLFTDFSIKLGRDNKLAVKYLPLSEATQIKNSEIYNNKFNQYLEKNVFTKGDIESLIYLSKSINKKEYVLKSYLKAFDHQKNEIKKNSDHTSIDTFLKNWVTLCPLLVSYDKLHFPVTDNFYIERWLNKELPIGFWENNLANVFFSYFFENSQLGGLKIFEKFREILKSNYSDSYNDLLEIYFNSIEIVDSAELYTYFSEIAETGFGETSKLLLNILSEKISAKAKVQLWADGIIQNFPNKEALENFSLFTSVVQDRIVNLLDEQDLFKVFLFINKKNSAATIKKYRSILERRIISSFSALSLDIESNGEQIYELAWGNHDKWFIGTTSEDIEDVKITLQNRIEESSPLIVGHNITEFDSPILKSHGVTIEQDKLWDTLLVEIILSPELRTYSLKTSHKAIDDASLALKIFLNQVLRLVSMDEEEWIQILPIFPQNIRDTLLNLRLSVTANWLECSLLKEELLTFIRPQPQVSSLLQELTNKLDASEAKLKVILASSDFWDELRTVPDLEFYTSSNLNKRFIPLNKEHVLDQIGNDNFERVLIERFFNYCSKTGVKPLPVNLPPIVRTRLSGKIDFETATIAIPIPNWSEGQIACLDVHELAKEEESLLQVDNIEVFVVEPDLISLTFKELLKEVDLTYIINNPAIENLWIKFSGGQSFIELSKEQATALKIEPPAGFTNFWIEKYIYGKYRIWGNHKWENHLAGFPNDKIYRIERGKTLYTKEQANYLVVNQRKLQKDIGITRFNPETHYRSRYWVVQKELISGIIKTENTKKPLVLLIQRSDEVETLQQYFNKLGYFIPDSQAPLSRRLELLHQSNRTNKILIATISEASKVINVNYLGPLNLVWDSFNLYENYYLAKGSKLFKKSITTSAEISFSLKEKDESNVVDKDGNSDLHQNNDHLYLQRDIFFLLKLQEPLINRIRSLLADDHAESKLWLLDARIEDFASLGDEWNAKKTAFKVWENKESYDSDTEIADACILSAKPDTDFSFPLDKTKKILASVFLPENKYWFDYQEEYLDKILPAKNNLLVSLPTGGGKSLLFQAPSLFRSSFTNRLTIVITPLKALMEDQVQALWKLGFYGSVDYINQDKSNEVMHIYRRLAGGELSLLFITPERFRSGGFIKAFTQRFDNDGGLEYAVYDEAHCISQWGHEFRPDYLYSGKAVQRFKDINERKFPVLLFSATVSEKIYQDFNLIFK